MSHGGPQGQSPSTPQILGFPNDTSIADIYAEGVIVLSQPNSIAFIFNRVMGTPPVPVPVAVIRVSPEQAKVMSLVLAKTIRDFEEQIGRIPVLRDALASLGLSESGQP